MMRSMAASKSFDPWVRLMSATGMTTATARRLIERHGSPNDVLKAAASGALGGPLGRAIASARPQKEAALLRRIDARFVSQDDPEMPHCLLDIPDPPALLRLQGTLAHGPRVAIVGTRRCSNQGLAEATRFATHLARHGVIIVSGGARGIDAAAHRGALAGGGSTIVVLGGGLGCPYPPEHGRLFEDIVQAGGAVLSEHHVNQQPRPGFFPRRNRLVCGLAQGVLVVEAPARSGAMLTARLAVDQQARDCWAVCADAHRLSARGGLEAIRDGWAKPVLDPVDVLGDLVPAPARDASPEGEAASESESLPASMTMLDSAVEVCILRSLLAAGGKLSMEALATQVQHSAPTVLGMLTQLQLLGAVQLDGLHWTPTPAGVAWLGQHRIAAANGA